VWGREVGKLLVYGTLNILLYAWSGHLSQLICSALSIYAVRCS